MQGNNPLHESSADRIGFPWDNEAMKPPPPKTCLMTTVADALRSLHHHRGDHHFMRPELLVANACIGLVIFVVNRLVREQENSTLRNKY